MSKLYSFPPIVDSATHTLILGSMPGKMSLSEFQYYAHPRNAFWHIMGEIYGAGFNLPYTQRLDVLLTNGIGLWDVIATCTRTSSLDSDIAEGSIVANDFRSLLQRYPAIRRLLFNGGKAAQAFNRYILPQTAEMLTHFHLYQLTSSSPANARYSIDDKLMLWRSSLLSSR